MDLLTSSCMWAAVQTKSTKSSSHLVLLMSGNRRPSRQFGRRRMLQSKIIRLVDCSSAPQMHLGVSRMPQRCRHVPKRPMPVLSLQYSVLPTDYGVTLSQTGDKRQGWPKTGPVLWHFPMPLSMTPGYWSRTWLALQHGGRRGVVNAGAVCQETVHYGQGHEGGG